jgi:hypothetical protein
MRWMVNIVGILMVLSGIVWILQGLGILPVGFMANDMRYTYAGIVLVLLAIGLFILANRRRK